MMGYLYTFQHQLYLVSVASIALILVLIAIPSILHVATHRNLFDDINANPTRDDRKIVRLGGIAIFFSFMVTTLIVPSLVELKYAYLLVASSIILFFVGLKDDLWGVNPSTKFAMQMLVAMIMVGLGDLRITSLYGIFNLFELPYLSSVALSVLVIVFLINAFNFIDGIDGLAGSTGLVVNIALGVLFVYMDQVAFASVAFALAGACIGFLKFNLTPARIFMGDTGSMLLGFISAVLAIQFIELNNPASGNAIAFDSAPAIAIALLIGPIFDALRVFMLRVSRKKSPFLRDQNHIHHKMLSLGLSHAQTTLVLVLLNLVMIGTVLMLASIGNTLLILLMFAIGISFNWALTFLIRSKKRKSYRFANFIW